MVLFPILLIIITVALITVALAIVPVSIIHTVQTAHRNLLLLCNVLSVVFHLNRAVYVAFAVVRACQLRLAFRTAVLQHRHTQLIEEQWLLQLVDGSELLLNQRVVLGAKCIEVLVHAIRMRSPLADLPVCHL